MANEIGWGQGTLNNTINWGKGFINTISWGIIYETSEAGETWIGYTPTAIEFRDRVITDGGTVESLECVKI